MVCRRHRIPPGVPPIMVMYRLVYIPVSSRTAFFPFIFLHLGLFFKIIPQKTKKCTYFQKNALNSFASSKKTCDIAALFAACPVGRQIKSEKSLCVPLEKYLFDSLHPHQLHPPVPQLDE
jgi:hypothetical protein